MKEKIMLVEGIGQVTFSNEILRIGTLTTKPNGEVEETGQIDIPRGSIEGVINTLVGAVNEINDKIAGANDDKKDSDNGSSNGKKSSKKK
tara:strand:- start:3552 stop:3821 length:270 start_codon:yes stop_codon:yes gene_type:complete